MSEESQENKYGNLKEKNISTRLDSVASSTSRARKTFLIMTIFCAAINIALWNGYLSWIRDMAMPQGLQLSSSKLNIGEDSVSSYLCNLQSVKKFENAVIAEKFNSHNPFKFENQDFTDIQGFVNKLNHKDKSIYHYLADKLARREIIEDFGKYDNQFSLIIEDFNTLLNKQPLFNKENFDKHFEVSDSESKESHSQNRIKIKKEIIQLKTQYPSLLEEQNEANKQNLEEPYFKYINRYFNRLILENIFQNEIRQSKKDGVSLNCVRDINPNEKSTNINSSSNVKTEKAVNPIGSTESLKCTIDYIENTKTSLEDRNRLTLIDEWIRSQTISINLLGIRLTTFDLSVLGSLSLVIIMIWHFFSIRRENRAIVPFLKQIYDETKIIKDSTEKKPENSQTHKEKEKEKEKEELSNLVFHGIVNNTVFIDVFNNDNPLKLIISEDSSSNVIDERSFVNTITSVFYCILWGIFGFSIWVNYWMGYFWYSIIIGLLILLILTWLKKYLESWVIYFGMKLINARKLEKKTKEKEDAEEKLKNDKTSNDKKISKELISRYESEIRNLLGEKPKLNELSIAIKIKEWWNKNKDEAFVTRWLLGSLIFLPSLTIYLIILSDVASLFDYSAFRKPDLLLFQVICDRQPDVIKKIIFFDLVAFLSFLMTTYISLRCKKFVDASSISLHDFYVKLKDPKRNKIR